MMQKKEHRDFMRFITNWAKSPKESWHWRAVSNQATPMLLLIIEMVMGNKTKLDSVTKQRMIHIISEATGLPPDRIEEHVEFSTTVLKKTKASAKK